MTVLCHQLVFTDLTEALVPSTLPAPSRKRSLKKPSAAGLLLGSGYWDPPGMQPENTRTLPTRGLGGLRESRPRAGQATGEQATSGPGDRRPRPWASYPWAEQATGGAGHGWARPQAPRVTCSHYTRCLDPSSKGSVPPSGARAHTHPEALCSTGNAFNIM